MDKPYRTSTKVGLWIARVGTALFAGLMVVDAWANATIAPTQFDPWNVTLLFLELPILVVLFVRPRIAALAQIGFALWMGGHAAGTHPNLVAVFGAAFGVALHAGLWWMLWKRLSMDEADTARPAFAAD